MVIAGIGYQGRSIEELVAALRASQVTRVLDVREVPWSRKPGFSKRALAEQLAAAGIGYDHLPAAGNPRANRRSAVSTPDSLAGYRAHLARDPAVLEVIAEAAGCELVALLCFEADWRECHRSVLLAELAARHGGLEILHL
jgi:uncharacterized protein (DUF488 family)